MTSIVSKSSRPNRVQRSLRPLPADAKMTLALRQNFTAYTLNSYNSSVGSTLAGRLRAGRLRHLWVQPDILGGDQARGWLFSYSWWMWALVRWV